MEENMATNSGSQTPDTEESPRSDQANSSSITTTNTANAEGEPAASEGTGSESIINARSSGSAAKRKWTSNDSNFALGTILFAFAVAAYVSQLQSNRIGEKANDIAQQAYDEQLWKDCRDRPDMQDTKACKIMLDIPFDNLTPRAPLVTIDITPRRVPDLHDLKHSNEVCNIEPGLPDFHHDKQPIGCGHLGFAYAGAFSPIFLPASITSKDVLVHETTSDSAAKATSRSMVPHPAATMTQPFEPPVTTRSTHGSKSTYNITRPNVFAALILAHIMFLFPLRDLASAMRFRPALTVPDPPSSRSLNKKQPNSATKMEYCIAGFALTVWSMAILVAIDSLRTGLTGDLACAYVLILLLSSMIVFEPVMQRLRLRSFPEADYPLSGTFSDAPPPRNSVVELAGKNVVRICGKLYLKPWKRN